MSIRICLTGRVSLEVDGEVLLNETHLRGKQGRLVFAYLVSERIRPVPKEELATVVWQDDLSPAWEAALSALTSRLRSLLSKPQLKDEGVSFARSFGQYQVGLPTDVWIDVEAVASSVDRAEAHIRSGNPEYVLGPAGAAVAIARRPFLPGIEGFWAESVRGRLQRQLGRALDCLSESQMLLGEPTVAVETATEAIRLDSLRERAYQLLMKANSAMGNRAEAIRIYHQLRELLADQVGTDPSEQTEAIYLELLE